MIKCEGITGLTVWGNTIMINFTCHLLQRDCATGPPLEAEILLPRSEYEILFWTKAIRCSVKSPRLYH